MQHTQEGAPLKGGARALLDDALERFTSTVNPEEIAAEVACLAVSLLSREEVS